MKDDFYGRAYDGTLENSRRATERDVLRLILLSIFEDALTNQTRSTIERHTKQALYQALLESLLCL